MAQRLGKEGAAVALVDFDRAELDKSKKELEAGGITVGTYHVDIRKHEEVKKCIQSVVDSFGKIDVLVQSAGVFLIRHLPFLLRFFSPFS